MTEVVRSNYKKVRSLREKLRFYWSVNWTKTIYFNLKKFPFGIAKQFPVYFYGRVHFHDISGKIEITAPIRSGMIGFGQPFELLSRSKGTAEIYLMGKMRFHGHVQFGKDYFLYIGRNATCEMGHMSSMGYGGKIICTDKVILGNYARIGFESQVMDSNFHTMIDTVTGKISAMTAPIEIGNYNYIGHRVTFMQKSKTPDYCTVASNSVCNADYTEIGTNSIIGGIPAKLLKSNIKRDWEGEKEDMLRWLLV